MEVRGLHCSVNLTWQLENDSQCVLKVVQGYTFAAEKLTPEHVQNGRMKAGILLFVSLTRVGWLP